MKPAKNTCSILIGWYKGCCIYWANQIQCKNVCWLSEIEMFYFNLILIWLYGIYWVNERRNNELSLIYPTCLLFVFFCGFCFVFFMCIIFFCNYLFAFCKKGLQHHQTSAFRCTPSIITDIFVCNCNWFILWK